jgi:hypothetical protein
MTAQVGLLNHQLFPKKAPEVLAEFDKGVQEWTKVDNAYHDSKLDVEAYYKFNKLNNTAMVTSKIKKARKEDELKPHEQWKYNNKVKTVPTMKCKHDLIQS